MDTTTNEKLHTEATVAPEGSQETKQDQQSPDQNNQTFNNERTNDMENEKKVARTPYNGSKEHGVVPAKLNDVEAATKAKKRLHLRLNYLNAEYERNASIIQDDTKTISEKVPAVKATERINEQLQKLQEVANKLKARIPELEELAKDSVMKFNPEDKVEVTI